MNIRMLLDDALPAARRPVRWIALWPLLLVLGLVLGGLTVLIETQRLSLAAPWRLLWLLVTPWVWWMYAAGWGGLGKIRGAGAVMLRLLLIAAAVIALCGPRALRSSIDLTMIYTLDCSDSISPKVIDQATTWLSATAAAKPAKDAVGLVVFGADAAVELPPRQAFTFDAISSHLRRDGTNLENSLALSLATLPEDAPGRIVLISDGTATEGDCDRIVDQLAARHVPVDVLPVTYERSEEVWLERLDLPTDVHEKQTYEAGIVLGSLASGHGTLVLTENEHEIARQEIDYPAGKSRYTLPLYLRQAGYYEYVATIEPQHGHDTFVQNNSVLGAISLRGQGHVLVVTEDGAPEQEWQALVQTLRQTGRSVDITSASHLPEDPMALENCDVIVLNNVAADSVSQMQQVALREAVEEQGIGLLMVGGQNGYGPGGWNHSPVEEALPVTMDVNVRKVMPKGALAIIIEMSEFPDGDGWAKLITKKAMQVLAERDDVGVVTYDPTAGEHWIFPMTPAKEYARLAPLVDGAFLGDMPTFDGVLKVALGGLVADDAAAKHLLIVSDGDPVPPTPEMLRRFVDAGIPISTVLIVPDEQLDIDVMKAIAKTTHGRFYYPSSPSGLPSVCIKEAKTIRRSEIQNVNFTPGVDFPSPILKGLGALPKLGGYTLTSPKPHAQVILKGPETDEEDPVLAIWRFGVGTSAAWTSDLSSNWGANWLAWDRHQAFIDQLFTALARAHENSQISLSIDSTGGQGQISIEDHQPGSDFLTVTAHVISPGGAPQEIDVPQVAPGHYSAHFPLKGLGRYHVGVSAVGGSDGNRHEHVIGSLMVSYSEEYLRFRANPQVLESIAHRTGGRVLTGREEGPALYGQPRVPRTSSRQIFDWLILAVALLLPLDVALRRVSVEPMAMLRRLVFWRRAQTGPTATMGALLDRMQVLKASRSSAAPVIARLHPAPKTAKTSPAQSASTLQKNPGETPSLTTSKLLEARRKREQGPPSAPP